MSVITSIENFFGIAVSKDFNTTLEHGKDYEFHYEVKGEITPENYADIRKTIIEKIPDVTFRSVDFVPEARTLIVRVHYASPIIPLVAYGLGALIVSAVAFIGLHLVLKDVKEVTPTVVGGFSQTVVFVVILIIALAIGYRAVFARKIGG
jgi:hypothetical protein